MNSKARYFLPSVEKTLFLTVFLTLSFLSGATLLNDADTGYHIRAGEYILQTFSVPHHDIFSFLSPPPAWTAHEWLSEVIMALLHQAFGLTGVVLFFILLISVTYPLLFRMLRTWRGNILADILIIILVIVSSALHWLARPHVFSLLLLVGWYHLLEAFQKESRNYLFLLPPLMLLWVNLHGGFVAGFLLLLIYFAGNIVATRFPAGYGKEQAKGKAKVLGYTILACLLVSLINPYGYKILAFPFQLISKRYLMDNVNEFMSPDFHLVMPFKYLLFMTIAIFAVSLRKADIIELSLILIFTNMALVSARYIPIFCVITAPILSRQAGFVLDQEEGKRFPNLKEKAANIAKIDASVNGYISVFAAVLLVAGSAVAGKTEFHFDGAKKPVRAVEFLKREHVPGNMFNNDEFGDYLIYAAYPRYRVFFDGRSDMYGEERVKEYRKVITLAEGWEEVIERYDIGWVFFDADSILSRSLQEKDRWRLIYADGVANIFVKDSPEYRDLIAKHENVRPVMKEDREGGG
jgi:hypothetical protein